MIDLESSNPALQKAVQQRGRYLPAPAPTGKPLLVIHNPPFLMLMMSAVLVGSLFLFMASTLAGMKYALADQKTLGLYLDIFPGEPASALDRFACKAQPSGGNPTGMTTRASSCSIFPQREPFHLIQVKVNQGKISELTFFSAGLQPETVYAYWGEPDTTSRSLSRLSYQLEWHKRRYSANAIVNESARAVHLITLRMAGQ